MFSRPLVALAALLPAAAGANEFRPALEALAEAEMRPLLAEPALVKAVTAQNARTAALTVSEIEGLDMKWRAQVGSGDAPLIDAVTGSSLAERLRGAQEAVGGLFSEVFVMDARGLNVAASNVTSDYWQGDEAKFTESFGAGPGAIHMSEIEFDESTQTYQAQVSLPVLDPASGEPIGAATFGVDVGLLP